MIAPPRETSNFAWQLWRCCNQARLPPASKGSWLRAARPGGRASSRMAIPGRPRVDCSGSPQPAHWASFTGGQRLPSCRGAGWAAANLRGANGIHGVSSVVLWAWRGTAGVAHLINRQRFPAAGLRSNTVGAVRRVTPVPRPGCSCLARISSSPPLSIGRLNSFC